DPAGHRLGGRRTGVPAPCRRARRRAPMRLSLVAAILGLVTISACGPAPMDPSRQIGPNPYLPPLHQYLLPPMRVSRIVGWGGAKPQVAAGLRISALATGLKNPRWLYVLPNGDVLVAESGGPSPPINRPKEFIMGWLERKSHSAEDPGQRITLLRDANGDGIP